jgi:Tol biopolymer transport system component
VGHLRRPDGRPLGLQEGDEGPGRKRSGVVTRRPSHRRRLAQADAWFVPTVGTSFPQAQGCETWHPIRTEKKHLVRGDAADPYWSPDVKRFAFTRKPVIGGSDVYIVNAAGGGERRLTRTGDSAVAMWAPGRKIVLLRPDISIINADGTGLRRIRQPAHGIRSIGGWTPDGKLLLYAVATHGISAWRLSDGSVRRLTRGSGDGDPTWASGGREIVFTRNTAQPRVNGIWIMNRDGSGARRIAAVRAAVCSRKMNCRYESMGKWYRWWNEYYTPAWTPG